MYKITLVRTQFRAYDSAGIFFRRIYYDLVLGRRTILVTGEEGNWCIHGELMDPERLDYL